MMILVTVSIISHLMSSAQPVFLLPVKCSIKSCYWSSLVEQWVKDLSLSLWHRFNTQPGNSTSVGTDKKKKSCKVAVVLVPVILSITLYYEAESREQVLLFSLYCPHYKVTLQINRQMLDSSFPWFNPESKKYLKYCQQPDIEVKYEPFNFLQIYLHTKTNCTGLLALSQNSINEITHTLTDHHY